MLLYRYQTVRMDEWGEIRLKLLTYIVVRESAASYWITPNQFFPEKQKVVRKNARKTFAYDTQKKALYNYIRRTKKYQQILQSNIYATNRWITLAEALYANIY